MLLLNIHIWHGVAYRGAVGLPCMGNVVSKDSIAAHSRGLLTSHAEWSKPKCSQSDCAAQGIVFIYRNSSLVSYTADGNCSRQH